MLQNNLPPDLPELNASILDSVKVQNGIPAEHTEFDQMIQLDINVAFGILNQMGVGPEKPYTITDKYDTWDEFICQVNMEMVKQFVSLEVRLMFDPPSGAAKEALERVLDEVTWRLTVAVDEDRRLREGQSFDWEVDSK